MFEKIRDMICEQLGLDGDRVTADARLVEDLCCDSLDVIELLSAAEDEFDLGEVPEEELAQMKTVGDLVRYIEDHVQEG